MWVGVVAPDEVTPISQDELVPTVHASATHGEVPALHSRVRKGSLHRTFRVATTMVGVVTVAWLDYWTGTEISFSVFYLAPIALLTWWHGRRLGFVPAVFSSAAWYWADVYGGHVYSHAAIPMWNAVVRLIFFCVAVEAIHRVRVSVQDANTLARIDSLTGLCNARAFRESGETELARCRRYPAAFSLAYIDVDDFKKVNDSLGHDEGDRVLSSVGATLLAHMRRVDVPARLGGDEFAVLLPQTDADAARAALEKLRNELDARARTAGWPVSFSIGIASFEKPPASVADMIRRADEVMYAVKHSGKNAIAQRTFGGTDSP